MSAWGEPTGTNAGEIIEPGEDILKEVTDGVGGSPLPASFDELGTLIGLLMQIGNGLGSLTRVERVNQARRFAKLLIGTGHSGSDNRTTQSEGF